MRSLLLCYFLPKVLYLGVEGTSKQRVEGRMNSANRGESEIRHDCWEFRLSTLAIDDLCSAGRTSQFWSYLRCWLLIFSSSRGKFSQSAPRDFMCNCVEQFSILESLKSMWRIRAYGGRRGEGGWGHWLLHRFGGAVAPGRIVLPSDQRARKKPCVYKTLSKCKADTGDLI